MKNAIKKLEAHFKCEIRNHEDVARLVPGKNRIEKIKWTRDFLPVSLKDASSILTGSPRSRPCPFGCHGHDTKRTPTPEIAMELYKTLERRHTCKKCHGRGWHFDNIDALTTAMCICATDAQEVLDKYARTFIKEEE